MVVKLLKSVILKFIPYISILYSYNTNTQVNRYKNIIFSLWTKSLFKVVGKNFTIQKPAYLLGQKYVTIGDNVGALERLRLECWDFFAGETFKPQLTIGDNVALGYNVHIGCINELRIGNNVLIGSNVFITDHNHGFADERDVDIIPVKRKLHSKGPVIICENVWIGDNVTITPNVTIGKNSIIGANSVVTKTVPAYSVAVGNPARVIRMLK